MKSFNTPVLLIFFNRPHLFEKVLESVSTVKPTKIFLSQDGKRNKKDEEQIIQCRELLKKIDWDCEIHKNFNEYNKGCGKHVSDAIGWAFQYTDRLIILEDDVVPSKSFYYFCDFLLEKYKDDERIGLITGMNHLEINSKIDSDYFFSHIGSIWGIATWKRVWNKIDFQLNLFKEPNNNYIYRNIDYNAKINNFELISKKAKGLKKLIDEGKNLSFWSFTFGIYSQILNTQLLVVPSKNLLRNIGIIGESSHTPSDIKFIPKGLRKIYKLKTFELDFPLKDPEYIMRDIIYEREVLKIMRPNFFIKILRKVESIFYRIFYTIIERKNYLIKLK